MTNKRALGKGLSALLENANTDVTSKSKYETETVVAGSVSMLPVNAIEANPFQPRTHFEEQALTELCESIRQHGIIQPVTVRKMGYDKYQLISGERRYKASNLAGLTHIPAYIRIANDQSMLEMALVENIQRENLDAIEVAISYKRLIDECSLTQEQLSEKVAKQRSTITNYLRLLKLPAEVQLAIRDKVITMGHARALVSIENEDKLLEIFRMTVEDHLSVRQVEELARGEAPSKVRKASEETEAVEKEKKEKKENEPLSFEEQKITNDLSQYFNAHVEFKKQSNGKGKIVIPFTSDDELQRILSVLDI